MNRYAFFGVIAMVALLGISRGRAAVIFKADFSGPEAVKKQFDRIDSVINRHDVDFHDGGMEIKAAGKNEKIYSIVPRAKLTEPFSVEFKATVLARSGKDNHFSVQIDGVRVVIRRWGLVCLRQKESKVASGFGGIGNNKLHSFLIESVPGKIQIFADGLKICEMPKAADAVPSLGFSFYNSNVLIQDLKVFSGERSREAVSANILRNSSFETITNGLPDYWGSAHWGITGAPWDTRMDEFRQRWRIDRDNAWDGKNSFKIEATGEPRSDYYLGFYSCWPHLQPAAGYTFSVYLKSDCNDLPVKLGPRWNSGTVTVRVGRDWKRYSASFVNRRDGHEQLMIFVCGKGTLWIDAAQLELGNSPGKYVRNKGLEGEETVARKAFLMSVPLTARSPVLDGTLHDSVWATAAVGKMVNCVDGKEPGDRTEFRMIRDDACLYIGVECFDRAMDRLVANVKKDKGPLWNDDSIEIFIKPEAKGNSYYQFVLNSLNFKYEGRTYADVNWNADWKHRVVKNKNSWTATIAIPFSTLAVGEGMSSIAFNICRNNVKTGEISSWAPTGRSFLNYKKWGRLEMNGQVGRVFVANPSFVKSSLHSGVSDLRFLLVNNSGKTIEGTLELNVETKGVKLNRSKTLRIRKNSTKMLAFSGLALPDARDCRVMLSLRSRTGESLLTKTDMLITPETIRLLREFSYFSDEKNMNFRLDLNGGSHDDTMLRCRLLRGGEVLQEKSVPIRAVHTFFSVPNRWGTGSFRLEAELYRSGKKLGQTMTAFDIVKSRPFEGKTNLWKRTIVFNGKELYLWGNYLESWPTPGMIDLLAANGFNNLVLMVRKVPASDEIRKTLDYLASKNMTLISWFGPLPQGVDLALKALPYMVGHPAFLALYPFDEIGGREIRFSIASLAARLRKATGPNTLFLHNENDYGVMQKADFSQADILSLDHYTIPERELESISQILPRLNELAGNRPTCFVAQSTGNAYSYGREPTPAELENQTWQALACDVWNIMFFANIPLGRDNFPTLKRLREEHLRLIDMGVPGAKKVELSCLSEDIRFICRDTGSAYVIIAVNLTNSSVTAKFSSEWLKNSSQVQRLFDSGGVEVKNGCFTDRFAPLARRVYEIKK